MGSVPVSVSGGGLRVWVERVLSEWVVLEGVCC